MDNAADDPAKAQAEAQRLAAAYDGMARAFRQSGLDVEAVRSAARLFGGLDEAPAGGAQHQQQQNGKQQQGQQADKQQQPNKQQPGKQQQQPFPLNYTSWREPLPPGAVRLVVVPIAEARAFAATARTIATSVARLLPPGTAVFENSPGDYHVTLFHLSHLFDPRPDTATAAAAAAATAAAPHARPAPATAAVAAEVARARALAASTRAPVLELDRVALAPTGSLLLLWRSPDGAVPRFRARMRAAFPGASARQATIVHTTLLRVLSARPLARAAVEAVDAECRRWTDKLRGTRVTPEALWFVSEYQFSTIRGERTRLPLLPPESGSGGGGSGGGSGTRPSSSGSSGNSGGAARGARPAGGGDGARGQVRPSGRRELREPVSDESPN